jgi:cytochrome c peroxidase
MRMKYCFFIIPLLILAFSATLLALDLTGIEQLGKELYFDKISSPDWMSCANCHGPKVGFTGPIPAINKKGSVYNGAIPQRFGNRKPPTASYATVSPLFNYDSGENLFFGGNFWDGRATGWHLGNPAAEQALGPFLNPVEQNNPSKLAVLEQIVTAKYADLWEEVWGNSIDLTQVETEYDRIGLAIAAYEGSKEVNQFTSKFDYYLKREATLTPQEELGMNLFMDENEGNCAACHIMSLDPNELSYFTDFTFDNLGIPKNPENPFYDMDEVYLDDGSPINPMGDAWIDYGLGNFLRILADTKDEWSLLPNVPPNIMALTPADLMTKATENDGKQKVPTLRNVDKRPGNNFGKAYGHNGYFKSLEEITHFYNTRDVSGAGWNGMEWPDPEVPQNVNSDELGDLGLGSKEEEAIVAFMKTLSDGYEPKKDTETQMVKGGISLKLVGANPFNPTTRFSYTLPVAGEIQLDVYNILGQKVTNLARGLHAAGEYQVDFNGMDLSSGIYIICFQMGREVMIQKVTLVK